MGCLLVIGLRGLGGLLPVRWVEGDSGEVVLQEQWLSHRPLKERAVKRRGGGPTNPLKVAEATLRASGELSASAVCPSSGE